MLTACIPQRNAIEYVQFNHSNIMVIAGDKLTITLFPTQKNRNKSVVLKILRNGVQYDNKRMTLEEYKKIRDLILETKQKDINLTQSPNKMVAIVDGGSNSIILKKDTLEKKLYTHGIIKEYHGKFYEATELILKAAKFEMKDVN